MDELRNRFTNLKEFTSFPKLTVFVAGSYGRLEASEYSDLDLFFLYDGDRKDLDQPRTHELQLFGGIINAVKEMDFPKFSNDCEFLSVLDTVQIVKHLGGPKDDHENYFTARMLLLLESICLYGEATYKDAIGKIIAAYFGDFHDHPEKFWPTFLLNDITRYWKTLLLNYESSRRIVNGDDEKKTKTKVRNFKLKFSRLTTCFATIAALGCHRAPVTEDEVIELTMLTPRQRLERVAKLEPRTEKAVEDVLAKYALFLEMTGLPTKQLEGHFSDQQKRTEMFLKAADYGDSMFNLLLVLDRNEGPGPRLLRFLVV
jgi:hypothetical protein